MVGCGCVLPAPAKAGGDGSGSATAVSSPGARSPVTGTDADGITATDSPGLGRRGCGAAGVGVACLRCSAGVEARATATLFSPAVYCAICGSSRAWLGAAVTCVSSAGSSAGSWATTVGVGADG